VPPTLVGLAFSVFGMVVGSYLPRERAAAPAHGGHGAHGTHATHGGHARREP